MSNDSSKMFMNVVKERHDLYLSRLDGMLDALSNNDQAKKLQTCKDLNQVSDSLSSVLAQQDRPGWLTGTHSATTEYIKLNKNPQSIVSGSSWKLLQKLMNVRQSAASHAWNFDQNNSSAYDFDEVFERVRNSSSVIELFDAMITNLEKMLATGEIDSVRANEALKKLISTLEQNKGGSYFSTVASWNFAHSFVKNAFWATLDEIQVVKPIKAAFEKTLKDMDIEVDKLHDEISSELKERFEIAPMKGLSHQDNPLLPESEDVSNS